MHICWPEIIVSIVFFLNLLALHSIDEHRGVVVEPADDYLSWDHHDFDDDENGDDFIDEHWGVIVVPDG